MTITGRTGSWNEIRDIKISWFGDVRQVIPNETTIGEWVKWCQDPMSAPFDVVDRVNSIRSGSLTSDELRKLKTSLPAASIAAQLKSREASLTEGEKVISASGLTQIDIDLKQNPHILSAPALRDSLMNIVFVIYSGLSVSSSGVWALIQIADPTRLKDHFAQLVRDFASLKIFIDVSKGGKLTDLRTFSPDCQGKVKETYRIYDRKFTPLLGSVTKQRRMNVPFGDDGQVLQAAIRFAAKRAGELTRGTNSHNFISLMAIYLNNHGVEESRARQLIETFYPLSEIKSNCISHPYKAYRNQFNTWNDSTLKRP